MIRYRRKEKPLRSTEGHILLLGLALVLFYFAFLSVAALFSARIGQALVGITATNVIFGRAAGMSLSYATGFGHAEAMPLNMVIETILVLLFYPLFVFSLKHLLVVEALDRAVDRVTAAAVRNEDKVRRYGIAGLAFFVFFPFSMTGPMVGCVIGYMIGLRPWVNITVVLASTYVAIVCWGLLLRDLLERLAGYSTYAPVAVVATIVALVIVAHFLKASKTGKERTGGRPPTVRGNGSAS